MTESLIDFSRTRIDVDGVLRFGKYRGRHIDDVAAHDDGYLEWMLEEMIGKLSDAECREIEDALAGKARPRLLRAPGNTLRVGDTVEVIGNLAGLRAGDRLPVAAVVSGYFVLISNGGRRYSFKMNEADRVVVVARAVIAPPMLETVAGAAAVLDLDLPSAASARMLPTVETALVDLFAEPGAPAPALAPPLPVPPAPLALPALPPAFDLPPLEDAPWEWTAEQRAALAAIAKWAQGQGDRMISLTGSAGTGKTSLLRVVAETTPGIYLSAMTGKAALRLRELTGRSTSTLHAVLYHPPGESPRDLVFDRRRKPCAPFLVVDESSMTTPQIYRDLQAWAAEGTRILLVGDGFQLSPILSKDEASVWGEDFTVFAEVHGPVLSTVMRSSGPILDAATFLRETGRVQTESRGAYKFVRVPDPLQAAVADYLADPVDHVIVTWRNELRLRANRLIRAKLGRKTQLPGRGEPILIRQNQGAYLNGELVIVDRWEDGPRIGEGEQALETTRLYTQDGGDLLVLPQGAKEFFDGGRPFIKDWPAWRRFCNDPKREEPIPVPVTYGYAMTAHACQGSQARRVTTFLGPGDAGSPNFRKPTRLPSGEVVLYSIRWLYTALTRATQRQTLYVSR